MVKNMPFDELNKCTQHRRPCLAVSKWNSTFFSFFLCHSYLAFNAWQSFVHYLRRYCNGFHSIPWFFTFFANSSMPFALTFCRWRVVDYFLIRTHGNVRLMNQLDVVGRTSELARLFGIQFNEVLTRGSQFRVESIMLRLVKARNYIPVSTSVQVSRLIFFVRSSLAGIMQSKPFTLKPLFHV